MTHDYYGWVALATLQEDRSSKEFDDGFHKVRDLISELSLEMGHDTSMPTPELYPQMVYFKGSDVESIQPVIQVLREIVQVFDESFGEVVFFDDHGDRNRWWDFSAVVRYRIDGGHVVEEA